MVRKMLSKKSVKDSKKKVENCRVVTDLLDTHGDAIESWRVFRIMSEFVTGFELLRQYGLAVSIFGSARTRPGDDSGSGIIGKRPGPG